MIDCSEAVRRMWAYLDRELAEHPLAEFETHLETCQRCCGELEFSRYLRQLVAEADGAPAIPPDIRLRVEGALAEAEKHPETSA